MNTDKIMFAVIGGITVLILLVILVTSSKSSSAYLPESVIGGNPIYKGAEPSKAKLTIVEFSDFECTFCAQYPMILEMLVQQYPEDLSIVFRHFPLQPGRSGSRLAAEASEAAGMQGKFWEYHNELFANQPNFTQEDLEKYAEGIGLDVDRFKQDLTLEDVKRNVEEDYQKALQLKLNGTPSFYAVVGSKTEKINLVSQTSLSDKVKEILGEPIAVESNNDIDINNNENLKLRVELENQVPEKDNMTLVDIAQTTLMEKLGLDVSKKGELNLVSWERGEWGDASMGCPKEGVTYAQVVTQGYNLVFEMIGNGSTDTLDTPNTPEVANRYEVHINKNGNAVYCE